MRFTPHNAQWRLLFFSLLLLILNARHAKAEPFIEFCDDFQKWRCGWEQRDPCEERIETERHDFTQSAVTVGRGVAQLEGGYTYFFKSTGEENESSHATPELLLRFGLTEDIEFRLHWNYDWQFADAEPDRDGAEDLRWSFKLQMTRQRERPLVPTSALEVRFLVPTGGEAWTTDRMEFGLDYIYQWEPKEGFTVAGSTGFGTDGLGDFGVLPEEPARDHFIALTQSAVLGIEVTKSTTLYLEWYGIFSRGLEDEFVVSVFDTGIDYYVTENFVVDLRIGVGLTGDSDDFFSGVGGGLRF